ncbi:MAG: hypothetical protein MUE56_06045 [Ignavibacteria bacterium]|nr:hypothetical protein [Ignavibacteria bacterium]
MMHQISMHLNSDYNCYFSSYYADGIEKWFSDMGYLEFTVLGNKLKEKTLSYLRDYRLKIDDRGEGRKYDLVITCSDLIIPKNIRKSKIILIQEGMTDPQNILYYLVKYLKFPRYIAGTYTNGLSNAYDAFCVASEGYKEHFINKGCLKEKIHVTGIPNFDNCNEHLENDFPDRDYVLVCTSDARETYRYENRKKFIKKALKIAGESRLIFKLHPNENKKRAMSEIKKYAPGSVVFMEGDTNKLIANCSKLITKYSTVVYVGLALGKEVFSDFDLNHLKRQLPLQNNGNSARNIAFVCRMKIKEEKKRNYDLISNSFKPVPEY